MPTPPIAKRVPVVHSRHAGPVEDPWAWLRDRDDPDTLAYLRAENAFADEWLAPLKPTRDRIFDEIRNRTQETDLSVPVPYGPWEYYVRTVEGLDYALHCRRPAPGAPAGEGVVLDEVVMLDENVEGADAEYFDLGVLAIHPAHHLLAWSADRDGSEDYELRFRDLVTGRDLGDRVPVVSAGGCWATDGETFLYVRHD